MQKNSRQRRYSNLQKTHKYWVFNNIFPFQISISSVDYGENIVQNWEEEKKTFSCYTSTEIRKIICSRTRFPSEDGSGKKLRLRAKVKIFLYKTSTSLSVLFDEMIAERELVASKSWELSNLYSPSDRIMQETMWVLQSLKLYANTWCWSPLVPFH